MLAVVLAAACFAEAGPASAGAPFSEYDCKHLWLERNGIYANKGYCFETARAIAVFGPRCYPPYGKLNAGERRIVSEIKRWERRKGCGG